MAKVKIIEKKLKRERAKGQLTENGVIEIDPRQRAYNLLNTEIHELFHHQFHDMSETMVRKKTSIFAKSLWDLGYRKVKLK